MGLLAVAWANPPSIGEQLDALSKHKKAGLTREEAVERLGGKHGEFAATPPFPLLQEDVRLAAELRCAITRWDAPQLTCTLAFEGEVVKARRGEHAVSIADQKLTFAPFEPGSEPLQLTTRADQLRQLVHHNELLQSAPTDLLDLIGHVHEDLHHVPFYLDDQDEDDSYASALRTDTLAAGAPTNPQPVPVGQVEASGSVDPIDHTQGVETLFVRHTQQVKNCYADELAYRPSTRGDYVVVLPIEAGRVRGIPKVVGDSERLSKCISTRIRGWQFPSDVTAIASWTWTFTTKSVQ